VQVEVEPCDVWKQQSQDVLVRWEGLKCSDCGKEGHSSWQWMHSWLASWLASLWEATVTSLKFCSVIGVVLWKYFSLSGGMLMLYTRWVYPIPPLFGKFWTKFTKQRLHNIDEWKRLILKGVILGDKILVWWYGLHYFCWWSWPVHDVWSAGIKWLVCVRNRNWNICLWTYLPDCLPYL